MVETITLVLVMVLLPQAVAEVAVLELLLEHQVMVVLVG
jgi:hypothetical protein